MGYWKKHFSSKHLDSGDMLDGTKPLIRIVAIGDGDPEETDGEKKMLVTFKPSPELIAFWKANSIKEKSTWLCSRTIGYQLEAMFGADDGGWVNKIVAVYTAPIRGGEAVRIYGSPQIEKDITIKVRDFGGKKQWTMRAIAKPAAADPAVTQ